MGKSKRCQVSNLSLEGRFLRFVGLQEHQPQTLYLATAEGEYCLKLSKKLQLSLGSILIPGDWVVVSVKSKLSLKTGKLKLKAFQVKPAVPKYVQSFPQPTVRVGEKKAKIMVCQKSPCMKRGAGLVCQALQDALSAQGLENQVSIKGTGCMNRCKAGPNLVFMPDKSHYNRVRPEEISRLVAKHFPAAQTNGTKKPDKLPH
ncbi:MAG TPA: (2Fe-2S) ferredoxin domain-containing protein [Candidatus Caenarcaniphilales bacterium]